MSCPICELPREGERCACGYDHATGERWRAARRARIVKARSTRKAWFGLGCIATVPLSALVVVHVEASLVASIMYFVIPVQLTAGILALWRGLAWRWAAQQRLARARELPGARVIE